MSKATHPNTQYGKGSTGFHTAVPPQESDGSSGGVPLHHNTPLLRKPAVLVTFDPDLSQGTPGTAISADLIYAGATPSGTRSNRFAWITSRLEQMQAQLYRKYLELELLALMYCFMLRYLRLVIRLIDIGREQLFHAETLPSVVLTRSVHDRRHALFRRRAVSQTSLSPILSSPSERLPSVGGVPEQQGTVTVETRKHKAWYTT